MKLFKYIRSAAAAALASVLMLTGCGSEPAAPSAHYEAVFDTVSAAVKAKDTDAYLLCFTDAARLNYLNSDSYDRSLAAKLVPSDEGEHPAMVFTVSDHRELNNNEISALETAYKDKYSMRIDITKAYEVKASVTSGALKAERTLNAVNVGTGWLLLGPVIESWFDTGAAPQSADLSSAEK